MWGNALGWCISVLIVVATFGGVILLDRHLSTVTPVTEFVRDPANLLPIELPVPPRSLLPPAKSADAADWYRQAIELYSQRPDDYERFAASARRSDDANGLDALDLLIPASECSHMNLFASSPPSIVRYGDKPQLAAIRMLGKSANRLGALLRFENRPDEAMKYHLAAFALGARLYEERLTLDELLAGLELMSEAAGGIVAGSSGGIDTERFQEYRSKYLPWYESSIKPTQRIITSIDPSVMAMHSGDVFYIARRGKERMWRVEAILKLGRLRFNAARIADQQAAARALQELGNDPDPVIQTAVAAARGLTIEQYRMLH